MTGHPLIPLLLASTALPNPLWHHLRPLALLHLQLLFNLHLCLQTIKHVHQ
jgi:hypothetical protein